ncbi:MAG TPA: cytochrome c-type biogenesis protein CcmH [Candidatus Eisenbacteria bacterium]|nr:cytochrome c-type biogenesis protein CcmH [Candidatus Eisenbacteria bacterium]
MKRKTDRFLVSSRKEARAAGLRFLALVFLLIPLCLTFAAEAPDLEEQTRRIASELRCVVCQNLSVADSPSEMAQQMRAIVREQLEAGKTPDEIKAYFVSKYGEWVLLAPRPKGLNLLLWLSPFIVLVAGTVLGLWWVRRWSRNKTAPVARREGATAEAPSGANTRSVGAGSGASDLRSELVVEEQRLTAEISELEFDFQCAKLSETDYRSLRGALEAKLFETARRRESLPPPAEPPASQRSSRAGTPASDVKTRLKRWQLAAGGAFLLLFGLILGVLLTQSLRPRSGPNDTLTGGFLTGTTGANDGVNALIDQGTAAYGRGDWPKAIEAFRKVLDAEPNQPIAHAYMGLILIQAGHTDGALLAFDRALSSTPNLPLALWGKGMLLYREKQDYEGARQVLGQLAQMLPAGEERQQVEKVLAEIPARGGAEKSPSQAPADSRPITGRVTLASKVQAPAGARTALFIIARSAAGHGPPVAVKKIDRPTFPIVYSLGPEHVMIRGRSFSGKLNISARLDRDGDPMTRETGDLVGEYRNNPVEAGSKEVDIVLDQLAK